jgi:hypothetical protein
MSADLLGKERRSPQWLKFEPRLSVPYRSGTPTYKVYVKMKGKACTHTHPRVHDIGLCHPARAARVSSHLLWRHLLARGRSDAAMCPVAPAPESQLWADLVLPRVPWCQLLPPSTGQLWSRHMSCGSSSRLVTQGSSGATMCSIELRGLWAIEVNKYPLVALSS